MTFYATPSDYIMLPFEWHGSPKLKRTWYTNILSGLFGNEQRSKLSYYVNHILEFEVQTSSYTDASSLRKRLFKNLDNLWGVPILPYRMKLAATALTGLDYIQVDNAVGRELFAFGRVILGSFSTYAYYDLLAISGNVLTLNGTLARNWGIGTSVYPMMHATLGDVQELQRISPSHYKISLSFTENIVRSSEYGV
jgi:hypothetical protein